MKLSLTLKLASGLVGAITLLTLISLHPWKVAFLGLAAAAWFASEYFRKAGK